MQGWFHDVVGYLTDLLEEGQVFNCRLVGEDTDAVRFNGGKIRQAGHITERRLSLHLIRDERQVAGALNLSGDITSDRFQLRRLHGDLSAALDHVPPDPHLVFPSSVESTEDREVPHLPAMAEVLPQILDVGGEFDRVGHYMAGRIVEGVATSIGLRRWYETHTYDLDLSLCLGLSPRDRDRSVKVVLGGTRWDSELVARRLERAREHATRLREDRVRLEPGAYRAYIAPIGWMAILRTLGWRGAFSYRAQENNTSPFASLHRAARLSPLFSLQENNRLGWTAPFNAQGFRRLPQLSLIEQGAARSLLVAPRTSVEFDVPTTGAESTESPLSFEIDPGELSIHEIAKAVGDGLYLDHLHYLNLSDHATASVTGLTRFAAFRVRGGEIAEPIEVARFDDSVLELLGDRLVGFTSERERIPEVRSYNGRSLGGALLPGAVVDGLRIVS